MPSKNPSLARRYYWQRNPVAHRKHLANRRAWAKKNPKRVQGYTRKWATKNPDKRRCCVLRLHYGITYARYQEMRKAQKYRCAICNRHERSLKKKLFVDHHHKTKTARGLLCHNCNILLGNARDDKEVIKAALRYLDKRFA